MSFAITAARVQTAAHPDNLVDSRLVRAHCMAALASVLLSAVFGILVSLQFFVPDYAGSWLTGAWGRLRFAHTQGIMLGWLGNAFLAFLYHAVPILTGRQVTSPSLGRWMFFLWNFVVLVPGWILVLAGISQTIEWAEFPLIIDVFVILALLCAAIQFLPPFLQNGLEDLYVSSWYIIGGLVFTLLAYPMGNILPELVSGAESAAFTGLWIHDAVGLFVTPLALAILYFVIPATTRRPIYSHFLSMLGFWGLFFFYPLNGTHHYVFSVIPMAAQMGAIAASALLGVVVVIVVTNLLMSMKGGGFLPKDTALRFVLLSVIFYLIVSVQGASQAQMPVNRVIHFSDWVIAHSHLAMLGFATFAAIGGIVHIWQRIPDARYNARAVDWSFWLLTVGITIMFIDLTIAGLVQAELWQSGAPWLESVQQSRIYWHLRTGSALPITAGFVLLFYGLVSGEPNAARKSLTAAMDSIARETAVTDLRPAPVLRMSYLVSISAAIVFFIVSIVLLGVLPGRVLDQQIADMMPDNLYPLSESEARGRALYASEGCAYCHTQQIRYLEADIQRFGAPTLAWEGQFDKPHMWGTRRIGPDLSRSWGARPDDWQYAHLYDPRSVVPWSVMPAYSYYFDGNPAALKQEARDLVAYIDSLGRARELAWPDGDARARTLYADDQWVQMSLDADINAHPAKARISDEHPDLGNVTAASNGQQLWQNLCAGCHGADGTGNGPAAGWLTQRPTNLALNSFTPDKLAQVLWNGVAGTSMPAWRDIPEQDLATLVAQVQSFRQAEDTIAASAGQLALGETVWQANCVQCHGAAGDGKGFAAAELQVQPTDFTGQQPGLGESVRVLTTGVPGTPMAPWTDRLSDAEILAVSHYLRQFFRGVQ
jgi:cytochrome c oxidase cbb3-type subunit I/II